MNSLAPHDFRPDVADAGVDLTGISGAAALSPDQVPAYLRDHYWWAYVHPNAVRVFERQWLVNAIVWGNYPRLRDLALDTLGDSLTGRTLQIACAYGDLTNLLAERIAADGGKLDVVDVLEVQTENLRGKLAPGLPVRLINMDSSDLDYDEATFDRTLLFFLLHEQPEDVRRRTIAEALRVTRPGGKLVIVATDTLPFADYLTCRKWHLVSSVFWNDGWFADVVRFVNTHGVRNSEWWARMLPALERGNPAVRGFLDSFVGETVGELFPDRESCIAFYSQPENFRKLGNGEIGDNLMYRYRAIASFQG